MAEQQAPRTHILTVALEDYYQVGAFNRVIQRGQWSRFERRLERGTRSTLDLLDECGQKATFFVVGWVADQAPELVREVVARGHEVASKGYYHRSIREMAPDEFREDLARSREAIERASGRGVLGYRVAHRWFSPADLWALDVLAEQGYAYDSSIAPMLRAYHPEPWRRLAHAVEHGGRILWELPISSTRFLGFDVPVAGGNYFRQLPQSLVRRMVARWERRCSAPFTAYFHVWELDPEQPKIQAAPWLSQIRQYRNLGRMPEILRHYLTRYRFGSAADYLGLTPPVLAPERSAEPTTPAQPSGWLDEVHLAPGWSPQRRVPVSVVVPCYNEELIVPYLANTLDQVRAALAEQFAIQFVLVDDASTDATWDSLQQLFAGRADCTLVRHTQNRGVAAAIMTGLRTAGTEIVCSIDCDCSYDPLELGRMIPMLGDDVDLVTASPYHAEGGVRNVPEWRLFLSRVLSRLYRRVLHHKLATYTSCFRVYRRSAFIGQGLEEGGFLGIAEMLGRLDLAGGRIAEFPTVLDVRLLGRSKMKVARTIVGHLRLLSRLVAMRLTRRPPEPITHTAPEHAAS